MPDDPADYSMPEFMRDFFKATQRTESLIEENWGEPKECPRCGKDMKAQPIKHEHRKNYPPGITHYNAAIGIYDQTRDRVTHYECPHCGLTWARL